MIIGRFIGKTSRGFETGKIYHLRSNIRQIYGWCICLYDTESSAWCPYSSLKAVLENWTFNIIE